MIREPIFKSTPLDELRPTQITVGMREVTDKRRRWRQRHGDKAGDFLASHMIPVVLGPKGRRYVTDHHHLARALLEEGVQQVATTVVLDLSQLEPEAFWFVLDNRALMHPFDAHGRRQPYSEHPEFDRGAGRRPVPLAGRRAAPRRRLRQGYDAVQRIPLGRFPAPAHRPQGGREGFRPRARCSAQTGQKSRRRLPARLVRPDRRVINR